MSQTVPSFRSLTRAECDALLARNHVGRLAYSFHDDVNIEPIHYVYADGVLYARTSVGHKLRTLEHHRWVAFEVDEVEGLFDWRSVVVRGSVYVVEPGETAVGRATYARTVARLRELVPALFSDDDPTPHRTVLFRIHVDRMTGRAATTGDGGAA
jgi:nitroimidazol reductase NimA-like FMN-containing flavoprotein (pyridoxamine 5'-phosphate oxidase superfamily)